MTPKKHRKWIAATAAITGAAIITACSGGGGGGGSTNASPPPPPPPPPPPAGITWQQGSFAASSTFADQCEVVRTGTDIEGNAFPDQDGSLVEELFWLRSWTDETYLWREEVADQDPNNFTDKLAYFDELRTTALTSNGDDKDNFHFSQPTADYLEARNSVATPDYGAYYSFLQNTPPRDLRISYTEPNTPASASVGGVANLSRGTRILEIDGIDLVNTTSSSEIDALNAALYPSTNGESHSFLVQDANSNNTRTITLAAEPISENPVQLSSVISTPSGDVGYIHFTTFSPDISEQEIRDAMTTMSNAGVSDLVLDLRYNGGGLLAVASQISYMIAGSAQTSNETFAALQFHNQAGNSNPVTGASNNPTPFYSTGLGFSVASGAALPTLNLNRVFILSTDNTCSASESVINGLRGIDVEVVLIGSTTCGKPYGFYPTSNCGETYYTIQFQGVNDKGFGDYAAGFAPQNNSSNGSVSIPGCYVADNLNFQLGANDEPLLAAALQYRVDGSCPAFQSSPTTKMTAAEVQASLKTGNGLHVEQPSVGKTNMDLSTPNTNWEQGR